MRVKKVCRCKTCQKIYPNGIVEICNCGTILGEKIPKAERLSKMFIPGATITFNPEAFQGYEEGVLRRPIIAKLLLQEKDFYEDGRLFS